MAGLENLCVKRCPKDILNSKGTVKTDFCGILTILKSLKSRKTWKRFNNHLL